MTEQERALIRLNSTINCNKIALGMAKQRMRDLQHRANEPAMYADSILAGVEVLKELRDCNDHIAHLRREIHRDEKEIFKYKLNHGETI